MYKCAIDILLNGPESFQTLEDMKSLAGGNILIREDRFSNDRQRIYWTNQEALDEFLIERPNIKTLVVFWLADQK